MSLFRMEIRGGEISEYKGGARPPVWVSEYKGKRPPRHFLEWKSAAARLANIKEEMPGEISEYKRGDAGRD